MKRLVKLFLTILIMVVAVPVFAQDNVTAEIIAATTLDTEVVLNATDAVDISFNDLSQSATYKVKLQNNSEDILYVNDLKVENLSEEFIDFTLVDDSLNAKVEAGQTKEISFTVTTLDISQAGRNVNDTVTLKFVLGDSVVNPETNSNIVMIIVLTLILISMFTIMFSKFDKRKKLSVFVIGTFFLGITVVSANEAITVELTGKITYTSQNLLKSSGTIVENHAAVYTGSTDVWQHYDKVKNIIISDDKTEPEEYEYIYDLTVGITDRVYGYLVENGDSSVPYDLYIVSNGVVYAPEDSTGLFSFPNVETINGLEYIEFEDTKVMKGMFIGDTKVTSVNTSSISFDSATDTSYMFHKCLNLDLSDEEFTLGDDVIKNNMFVQYLYDIVKKGANTDKDIDFSNAQEAKTYYVESTKNEEYPVYYYRGAVTNNNVKFANFCWKIVRTTETGGVKLIYNGVPAADGSCNNTGTASQLSQTSAFNSNDNSLAYIGYMYGAVYDYQYKTLTEQNEVYLYGNDISWDGTKYKLSETQVEGSDWSKATRETLAEKYHYTCFNSTGECEQVYYIYYFGDAAKAFYITLTDGNNIENAKNKMFNNLVDSTIKIAIEQWYETKMRSYTTQLEDTVWCNDRSIIGGALQGKDIDASTLSSYFGVHGRINGTPSVVCPNSKDSFTVNKDNGILKYPVGLLTADEMLMAGYSKNSYLYTATGWWSLSPDRMSGENVYVYAAYSSGELGVTRISNERGVRPAISLKQGIDYLLGDGSSTNPYIVE